MAARTQDIRQRAYNRLDSDLQGGYWIEEQMYNKRGAANGAKMGNWVEERALAEEQNKGADALHASLKSKESFATKEEAESIQVHRPRPKEACQVVVAPGGEKQRFYVEANDPAYGSISTIKNQGSSDYILPLSKEPVPINSMSRQSYVAHVPKRPDVGVRQLAMEAELRKQAEEMVDKPQPEAASFETSYRASIAGSDAVNRSQPLMPSADATVHLRDQSVTFYSSQIGRSNVPASKAANPALPFAKSTAFSKPMSEYNNAPFKIE